MLFNIYFLTTFSLARGPGPGWQMAKEGHGVWGREVPCSENCVSSLPLTGNENGNGNENEASKAKRKSWKRKRKLIEIKWENIRLTKSKILNYSANRMNNYSECGKRIMLHSFGYLPNRWGGTNKKTCIKSTTAREVRTYAAQKYPLDRCEALWLVT